MSTSHNVPTWSPETARSPLVEDSRLDGADAFAIQLDASTRQALERIAARSGDSIAATLSGAIVVGVEALRAG